MTGGRMQYRGFLQAGMSTTTILLIRHGSTGIIDREQRPEDPLSAEGRREVTELARGLEGIAIEAFYASPYRRALETAELLAKDKKIEVDSRLREIPLWADPQDLARDERREELIGVLSEAQDGIESVLRKVEEHHEGQVVALVCHGNIIRATLALVLRMSLETVVRIATLPARVTVIEKNAEGYRLTLFNARSL